MIIDLLEHEDLYIKMTGGKPVHKSTHNNSIDLSLFTNPSSGDMNFLCPTHLSEVIKIVHSHKVDCIYLTDLHSGMGIKLNVRESYGSSRK